MSQPPLLQPAEPRILSLTEETQFAANGIVSRTLLNTPEARVVLFGFAAGQELTEHTSTRRALIQILSGRCDFSLAGQWHSLDAGAFVHLPPNTPHAVRATEPFSMLLTLVPPTSAPGISNRSSP